MMLVAMITMTMIRMNMLVVMITLAMTVRNMIMATGHAN